MNVVLFTLKMAGLNTAFQQAYEVYKGPWDDAMMRVVSTGDSEHMGWLGDVPQMQEWKSELAPQGLNEFDYWIKNRRFGVSLLIKNDDLADDRYAQVVIRISSLAENALEYGSVLLRDLRTNGETALCYDGQPFFSTAHQEGDSPAQSNLVAGTGLSVAQIQADHKTARAKMLGYVTDKGNTFVRSNPRFVAVCSPDAELALKEGLMLTTLSAGGQNVHSGLVSAVEVDPGLTGNSWYLEDRAPKIKAFVYQIRQEATPKHTMPGSDTDVKDDATLYVVKMRGNGGYGQWRNCVKIKNS